MQKVGDNKEVKRYIHEMKKYRVKSNKRKQIEKIMELKIHELRKSWKSC